MAGETRVAVERDAELDGLVTITLTRPEKLNALDIALHDQLQAVLVELETDVEARVVVLVGEGRAFSAGAQLGERGPTRRSTTSTGGRAPTTAAGPAS